MRDTLALVWVAASLLWIHALNRDLANAEEPLLSDLERTRPAPHLWLAFPPPAPPRAREIPAFGPYLHLGQAFAAQLGGRAFLTQDGSREIHPVLMKPDAYPQSVILPSPEERHMMSTLAGEARASMLKSLVVRAAVSVPRLGVLVPTQDHAALADLGFRTLWTGKAMLAAEPQLCDRPIEVSGPLATIEVGVSGDAGGLLEMEVPVRASVQLPCAGVWVRVLSGCPSQSLTTGQGPVRCESPGESERARDVTGAETRQ